MVLMVDGGRNSRHILQPDWLEGKIKAHSGGILQVPGAKAREVRQIGVEPAAHALARRDALCASGGALQRLPARLTPVRETAV